MNQKGFSRLILIVIIGAVIVIGGGGFWYYQQSAKLNDDTPQSSQSSQALNQTQVTEAPQLQKQNETTVAGANLWFFAVDDGEKLLAVSAAANQEILLGRLDPNNSNQPVVWKTAIKKTDSGGKGVADFWHIFAHNFHWIVFSTPGDQESYLTIFDKNFDRIKLVEIKNTTNIPTNDMFLVEETGGVAVGHFLPGTGHRVYRFDEKANLKETIDVGGGQYIHTNGSSAEITKSGFIIFASDTLNPGAEGGVKKIVTDQNWKPISSANLLFEPGKNIVMATSVLIDNGYRVVNARVVDDAKPPSSPSSPPLPTSSGQLLKDDAGAIVRFIISPGGEVASREVIAEEGGNRPHTAFINNLLITTWDSAGTVKIRVDKVSFE